jgi:molybdopterin/thiamine biosynthesis adenylyltransferase
MAIDQGAFSRPARLAASLARRTEEECAHLFLKKAVLICLEPALAHVRDARETFLFAINQVLRFCPNIGLRVPSEYQDLADRSIELAGAIHGPGRWIQIISSDREAAAFDAIINVGTAVKNALPWITVNSSGWLARVATARSGVNALPWSSASANACGALAAACLSAGAAFLTILRQPPNISQEISLFTHQEANLGLLHDGPTLPSIPLDINAFLVGCGAVTNGWAYTIKRLPMVGTLQAIDRQSLRIENLGPYVLATRAEVGTPKAQIIAEFLTPTVAVTPRPEEWELFKIRLNCGIAVPPLIINGLDHVGTRHSVQRLWPETLIDMGAGGLTAQVIVKPTPTDALCLLRGLDIPPDEIEWAERLALETGLSPERIRNQPITEITEADVVTAGQAHRAQLEKVQGKLICGRITEQNLTMETANPDFTPAVPFVTAFSGVVGAAETLKRLMGLSSRLHLQRNFHSNRSRALQMVCDPECECQKARG